MRRLSFLAAKRSFVGDATTTLKLLGLLRKDDEDEWRKMPLRKFELLRQVFVVVAAEIDGSSSSLPKILLPTSIPSL